MELTSQQITGSETLQTLNARHSVRTYKQNVELSQEALHQLLEVAGRAPSAWNLQHWKYLIIQEQADKEKLLPLAYNQKQVVDSSVTIVILGDTQANKNAEEVYAQSVAAGAVPAAYAERTLVGINNAYANYGPQFGSNHAYLNSGLMAMQLMIAAKAMGYDSVPMTGFDAAGVSAAFEIDSRYVPTMIISIGLSDEPPHQTPRLPVEKLIYKKA